MEKKKIFPVHFESFFRWFCKPTLFEELQGDLEEQFILDIKSKGKRKAAWAYRKEVILMLRPSVMRNFKLNLYQLNSMPMLFNYIKTAVRNIRKGMLFSGINIVGLSLSMAVGLLVISGISYQFTFDQFHQKKEQIYRVITEVNDSYFGSRTYATAPAILASDFLNDQESIDKLVRISSGFGGKAKTESKALLLDGIYADKEFFDIFSFQLLEGDASNALDNPFSIVLTKEMESRFFDQESAIGKAIEIEDIGFFQVTGIVEDPPVNSHLRFNSLVSFSTLEALALSNESQNDALNSFENLNYGYIYLLVNDQSSVQGLENSLSVKSSIVNNQVKNKTYAYQLQALTDIVPGKALNNQIGPEMETLVLIIFSILAGVIIFSTCFNYTNLSLARALGRTKEIAVRKALGGSRFQVFLQFIVEAVVIALLALFVAILFSEALKPYIFSIDVAIRDTFSFKITMSVALYFLLFAVIVGVIAGFLPAIILSKQSALKLLKGADQFRFLRFINLRKGLIIFQFTLSLICIIVASVLVKQFQFSVDFDMGFDREQVLNIKLNGADQQIFRDEFSRIPEVKRISMSSGYLGVGARSKYWIQNPALGDSMVVDYLSVDHNYLINHNIPLLAGKNFDEFDSESRDELIIINEEFLKEFQLGMPLDAIGNVLTTPGNTTFRIIGVTSNFNYDRLRNPIKSFFFTYQPEYFQYANLKMNSPDIISGMEKVETSWEKVNQVYELDAVFYDDRVEEAYSFYKIALGIIGFVTLLTVLIACMGLLGIVVYTSKSRSKEVAIRKVLGAEEKGLVYLLSKNFIGMMIWATLVSVSITFPLFNFLVLPNEAYKADLGFWEFGFGVILIGSLGLITIISQTLRVARANPVDSIHKE